MTEMTTMRAQSTPRVAPMSEPALIAEEQVRFGTAAARVVQPPAHPHWASAVGAVRGLWHSHSGPEHRHYPQRFPYLENALLSRESDRL